MDANRTTNGVPPPRPARPPRPPRGSFLTSSGSFDSSSLPPVEPSPQIESSPLRRTTLSRLDCEKCDEAEATLRCQECSQNLCSTCSKEIHVSKWSSHDVAVITNRAFGAHRQPIPFRPAIPSLPSNSPTLHHPPPTSYSAGSLASSSSSILSSPPKAAAVLARSSSSSDTQREKPLPKKPPVISGVNISALKEKINIPLAMRSPLSPTHKKSEEELKTPLSPLQVSTNSPSPSNTPSPLASPRDSDSGWNKRMAHRSERRTVEIGRMKDRASVTMVENGFGITEVMVVVVDDTVKEKLHRLSIFGTSSVGQLLSIILKKAYGHTTPHSKEEKKDVPYFFSGDLMLDNDRAVLHYREHLKTLELRMVKHSSHMIQLVTEQQTSSKRVVDEATAVWSVMIQPLRKLQSSITPDEISHYGLSFDGEDETLDELEFMSKYQSHYGKKLRFRRNPQPPEVDLQIVVRYKTSEYNLNCNLRQTVYNVLMQLIKVATVQAEKTSTEKHSAELRSVGLFEWGLHLPIEDEDSSISWLNDNDPISHYALQTKDNVLTLELRARSRGVSIEFFDETKLSLNLASDVTIDDLLSLCKKDFPELFPDEHQYQMSIPIGSALLGEKTVWSCAAQEMIVQRAPQPLIVFYQNKQKNLMIDYSVPLHKCMMSIWLAFGIAPKKENEYNLRRLSPDAEIDKHKSLASQSIPHNSAITLKIDQSENQEKTSTRNDVNIWEEVVSPQTAQYEGNSELAVLSAGTLNMVVQQMTSYTNPQPEFMKAALMTLASFTTPQIMLAKLLERYNVPIPSELSEEKKKEYTARIVIPTQLRVGAALKAWMENHPQDFDFETTQIVIRFCDTIPPSLSNLSISLRNVVLQRTCANKTLRLNTAPSTLRYQPDNPANSETSSSRSSLALSVREEEKTFYDSNEEETARQFCLTDSPYFADIMPSELLNQNWSKNQDLAPNVIRHIERINAVSNWVAIEVIRPFTVKVRAYRFSRLIKIAEYLDEMNNFSTLMAFLGGFNNSAVTRLKFTKALLPKKSQDTLARLEAKMSSEASFQKYRSALRTALPPGIPFIGVHLSDLTFTDDGNPDYIGEHKLINMTKRILVYRVITEIDRFRSSVYRFAKHPEIENHIKFLPAREEKLFSSELYDMSLTREPRGADKVA